MADDNPAPYFALFYEVGIINQISTAFLEARMPVGLLASHFGVVSHLIRVQDGATPLQLAQAFQVPKTTMTHTLSGLEKHGFVEMKPNPDDKRSKQVWLTDAGREFRDSVFGNLQPVLAAFAEQFPADRIAEILPELSEFRKVIDRLRDDMK